MDILSQCIENQTKNLKQQIDTKTLNAVWFHRWAAKLDGRMKTRTASVYLSLEEKRTSSAVSQVLSHGSATLSQ